MSDVAKIEHVPVNLGIDEEEFIAQSEANSGFKKDESVIPFTRILQPLSPQIGVTPGAVAGMIMNIASGTLTDGNKGMKIIPVVHQWNYTEWVPRESGGGFVADWGEDETGWQAKCEPDQKYAYKPLTKDGHVIVKARHFFIFSLNDDGSIEPSILPFTGTGLKIARQWSNIMENAPKLKTSKGMRTPAYFYYVYQFKTEQVKNGQYTWYEPRIRLLSDENKAVSIMERGDGVDIWKAAINLRDSLKAGTIRAASQDEGGGGSEDTI
jgi:hypothetical protein